MKEFESNKLDLTKSNIVLECVLNLPKSELPIYDRWSICKFVKKYDFSCYKLYENKKINSFASEYVYKIIIGYEYYHLITQIFTELEPHMHSKYKNKWILQINNCNNFSQIIEQTVGLIPFTDIIFGKQFTGNLANTSISDIKNIRTILFKSNWSGNLKNFKYLPENINRLEFVCSDYRSIEFFSIPPGIKKIQIINKKEAIKYPVDLTGLTNPSEILFINSDKKIINFHLLKYDVILIERANKSVNLTNLPDTIQMIKLYDGFGTPEDMFDNYPSQPTNSLDYLPDSIVKIVFDGKFYTDLSNIPSSVKTISFTIKYNFFDFDVFTKLPDSIQIIHLIIKISFKSKLDIVKLPNKLEKIIFDTDRNYYDKKILKKEYSELIKSIEKYKELTGKLFDMVQI